MAGKLHDNYARTLDATGDQVKGREARAYAEGYQANRLAVPRANNPFPNPGAGKNYDWESWDQGWLDGNVPYPSTHVGGPTSAGGIVPGLQRTDAPRLKNDKKNMQSQSTKARR